MTLEEIALAENIFRTARKGAGNTAFIDGDESHDLFQHIQDEAEKLTKKLEDLL